MATEGGSDKETGSPLEPPEGAQPYRLPTDANFELLASRTMSLWSFFMAILGNEHMVYKAHS